MLKLGWKVCGAAVAAALTSIIGSSANATDLSNSVTGSVSDGSSSLPYRLFEPQGVSAGQKVPLILFLHGAGDRGSDNVGQTYWMNQLQQETKTGQYAAYVLAPQINTNQWWSGNGRSLTETEALTMQALKQVESNLPSNVDTSRVYITGVSMGSFGTWDLASKEPNTFAAAVPMSGGVDSATAAAVKGTPVWAFHGSADNIVNVQSTRDSVAALQAAGGDVKYTEIAGGDHFIWPSVYSDPALYQWMFSHDLTGAAPLAAASADVPAPTPLVAAAAPAVTVAPTPEPTTLGAALVGGLILLRRGRRKSA